MIVRNWSKRAEQVLKGFRVIVSCVEESERLANAVARRRRSPNLLTQSKTLRVGEGLDDQKPSGKDLTGPRGV